MKNIFIIFILIFTISIHIYAKEIQGVVKDAETGKPVAFANISLKGYAYGTISNENGYFKINIPEKYNSKLLVFSFVGYETKEIIVKNTKSNITIKLKQIATQIEEVIINPDSNIFTFLKKIYKKIPENYPTKTTELLGFYREASSKTNGDFIYLSEAIIKSQKTSYKNTATGQVEIVKSRKNILPSKDSVNNTNYYGGLFINHFGDIVHERYNMINPKKFKNYKYEYLGKTKYNNNWVHKFYCTKNNFKSYFYVDANTLAYVYFEMEHTGWWQREVGNLFYSYSSTNVLYEKHKDKWFLKSIVKKDSAYNSTTKKRFLNELNYVTTSINEKNIKTIEYDKQVNYTDIFTNIAEDYNSSYWKGYNILEQDSASNKHIEKQLLNKSQEFLQQDFKQKKETKLNKIKKIIRKINYEIGFFYSPNKFNVKNVSIYVNNINLDSKITNKTNVGFYFMVGYKITKRWSTNVYIYNHFFNDIYKNSIQLGTEYIFRIKGRGKQFFAIPSIRYAYGYNGYYLGKATLKSPIIINNKKLDYKNINIYSGKLFHAINGGLKFKTNISNLFSISAGIEYMFPIVENNKILFEEDKILFKNKAYQSLSSNNIKYYEDNIKVDKSSFKFNNWTFTLGLSFNF